MMAVLVLLPLNVSPCLNITLVLTHRLRLNTTVLNLRGSRALNLNKIYTSSAEEGRVSTPTGRRKRFVRASPRLFLSTSVSVLQEMAAADFCFSFPAQWRARRRACVCQFALSIRCVSHGTEPGKCCFVCLCPSEPVWAGQSEQTGLRSVFTMLYIPKTLLFTVTNEDRWANIDFDHLLKKNLPPYMTVNFFIWTQASFAS